MRAMRDWTGTTIQQQALTVPCRYCQAPAHTPCHQKGDDTKPLEAFPAHEVRIRDSRKADDDH
ncbi:hypothetical protein MTY414_59790 [Mycolicibacterium mageritense]|nr:hypothetical protein MTY414_59790 [Mycolicibacterium mageritense]